MPLNLSGGGGSSISDCDPSKGQSRAKGKGKGKGQGKKGSSGPKVVTLDMEVPSNPTVQAQLVAELTNSPSISRVDLQSDRILLELGDTAGSLDWRLRQELKEVAHNIVVFGSIIGSKQVAIYEVVAHWRLCSFTVATTHGFCGRRSYRVIAHAPCP